MERREMLRIVGAAAGMAAAGVVSHAADDDRKGGLQTVNPYGGGPSTGITLPPYFKPTPSVVSAANYFPLSEKLGADEMRISFLGTCPFPPRRTQAATCIMVELGNGGRFFFDFGPGCLRNIIGMQVPVTLVNDIFITHLHVDHFGELPYLFAFAPWVGRWSPLRVHGPSGRNPEEGTKAMIDGMKQMTHWHTKSFSATAVGKGYEVEVNEFDWNDDGGICYDKDGVTVRHWRRIHNMDGASAYRLDWNGLSFVWTGDGRPDELTTKFAKGADVFVTELQLDTGKLNSLKNGVPEAVYNQTIDAVHTSHYGTGYVIKQVNPRAGMVTHTGLDHELLNETIAGVRVHWDGLFLLGAPDGVVVNVTKDAIWARTAVIPEAATPRRATPDEMRVAFGGKLPDEIAVPNPPYRMADLVDAKSWANEIDPKKYVPADVQRPLIRDLPRDLKIKPGQPKIGGSGKKS